LETALKLTLNLDLSTLNCRKALNGAKRLNDWNVWNGLIPRDERSVAVERLERLEPASL